MWLSCHKRDNQTHTHASTQMLFLTLDPDLYPVKMFSRNNKSSVDNCQTRNPIRHFVLGLGQMSSCKILHCALSVCICNSSIATIVALVIFDNCYKNNYTMKNLTVLLILLAQLVKHASFHGNKTLEG